MKPANGPKTVAVHSHGWLDFYLGTGDPRLTSLVPNRMFRNAEGKRFQDVSTSGGFGHLQKGHARRFRRHR